MKAETEQQPALPNGWEWVSIGETGEYINGFAFKPVHREDGGLPIVRIQNLTDETKPLNTTSIEVHEDYQINTGDMLMSWSATLDVFVWRRGPALVNQHIFKVVPEERVMLKDLLFHWLKRAIQQLQKTDHLHGSTMMHINRGPFMAHMVPLPPLAEQIRIVAKLEELLSDLDTGVAELKAAQKKLGQYRQSLLKAAVEGALTAEWREEQRAKNTPSETGAQLLQRILTERRARWEAKQLAKFESQGKAPPKDWQAKYPEPVKPDTTDLPALPQGWVWGSLDQLTEFITSGSRGWADYYSDSGATFIRSQNINKDRLDLTDIAFVNPPSGSEGARTRVGKDDLLLTITGANVGKTARVDLEIEEAYVSQHVALIRMIEAKISDYVHMFLTSTAGGRGQLDKEAYGAGKPGLNLQQVAVVAVPLPGDSEIRALMESAAMHLRSASDQEAAITASFKQSTAQRQNILRAAFAGQLVPQDPNDEPASVLLERIRAERAARETVKKPRGRRVKESV